jgi:hypothetical protein
MSRDNQVVVVNYQIAHRTGRQIQLKRLPVIPIIERHEYSKLGAGKE